MKCQHRLGVCQTARRSLAVWGDFECGRFMGHPLPWLTRPPAATGDCATSVLCVSVHGAALNSSPTCCHLGGGASLCCVGGVGLVCLVCWAWICCIWPCHSTNDVEITFSDGDGGGVGGSGGDDNLMHGEVGSISLGLGKKKRSSELGHKCTFIGHRQHTCQWLGQSVSECMRVGGCVSSGWVRERVCGCERGNG